VIYIKCSECESRPTDDSSCFYSEQLSNCLSALFAGVNGFVSLMSIMFTICILFSSFALFRFVGYSEVVS
jgi:hypothetical protein